MYTLTGKNGQWSTQSNHHHPFCVSLYTLSKKNGADQKLTKIVKQTPRF